jgi:hypothetical protein
MRNSDLQARAALAPRAARRRRCRRADRGQATAELALGLPTLGAVVLAALWLLAAAGAQAHAQEAARIGARVAARGDDDAQVTAWARRAAPAGAAIAVARRGDEVTVTVQVRLASAGALLPALRLTASAVAPAEPAPVVGDLAGPSPAGSVG